MRRPVIIGVGNPCRGDDCAGRIVVQMLRGYGLEGCDILEARGEATEIFALLEHRDHAILIDACVSGAPVGTIHTLDLQTTRAPERGARASSHGFGLAQAVELARALGVLPQRCVIHAIEAARFDHGASMTPEVAAAALRLAELIGGAQAAPWRAKTGEKVEIGEAS